ncbi:PREDICTED: protein SRG1-like isoform X2 [Tarenaya hassleriana]|uniref:protein SRG1-like isoform X2 n=1 Tax=Tarenaya hassleriana TaxID=28532 RepID=UPI00053C148F|nr:PREDICTED: protein SRG1-like isoform X2 [Tarenaya hassleriana]
MEGKGARQWSSLTVPSVQELVKDNNITTVPPRYVRSDKDGVLAGDEFGNGLPVIDLDRLCSATTMDAELEKLDSACRQWGFFQLVNHGVDTCLLEKAKEGVRDLFNLPMEEKKKLWQRSGDLEGFGQAFVLSEDQNLDWADMFFLTSQPVPLRRPHLFPKLPLPFRDALDAFSTQVMSKARILISKMARALEVKPEEMEGLFDDGLWQTMRLNYYPPCPEPDKVVGLTPHSDAVGLTILLHVNEVEGLQIKKDGGWVPVKPLPDAFVVNVGDIIESVEHRAMVKAEKERLSVGVFHSPGFDKEIGPAKSLVRRQHKALFRSISTEDYFNGFFSKKLEEKSQIQLMRI